MPTKGLFAVAVLVLVFTLGVFAGWTSDGNLTADWVSAGGTWVGAIGTIAAILWAIHTFSHQVDKDSVAKDDRRTAEENSAKLVDVRSGHGTLNARNVSEIVVSVDNQSGRLVEVESIDVDEAVVSVKRPWAGPKDLAPNAGTLRISIGIESYGYIEARGPAQFGVEVTYKIEGVRWKRSPNSSPVRLNA